MNKKTFWFLSVVLAANVLAASYKEPIDKIRQFYGERAGKRAVAWSTLLADSQHVTEPQKLTNMNDFFNQFRFISDQKLWGKEDYWATPYEFIGAGAGDCEDFSIAKYQALIKLGVADSKLRLVYVKALELDQFHMVVAYYPTPSAVPLILDNLNGDILPATARKDLLPIYSFNGSKLWLMKSKGQSQVAGKASRLSLWNDLRSRSVQKLLHRPNTIY